MSVSYKNFPTRQPHSPKQLTYQNQLLNNQFHHPDNYQHLFINDDSLFMPSPLHDQTNTEVFSFKNRHTNQNYQHSNIQTIQQLPLANQLDSFDFNQFIQIPQQINNNTKCKFKNRNGSFQCTFKPNILRKSNQIAINMQPSFERLTMAVKTSNKKVPYRPINKQIPRQYSKQRIERLSKPRIIKTQPTDNEQYCKLRTQKKFLVSKPTNYMDVVARNQLWQQQKQQKIEKLRKQQQQIQLKKQSSSFAPRLTQYKGQKLAYLSNFGKQGMVNYFERVSMAKSKGNNYSGKQNSGNSKKQSSSPYCSAKLSKTSRKDTKTVVQNKQQHPNKRVKYDEAVKQLHKKLMSLNI